MRSSRLPLPFALVAALIACGDEAAEAPPPAGVVEAECLRDSECADGEACRGGRCVLPGGGGAGGGAGGQGGDGGGTGGAGGALVERCGNGLDDDANGATDCDDAACLEQPDCAGGGGAGGLGGSGGVVTPVEDCDNLLDDDRDGRVDCLDADCAPTPACSAAGGAGGGGTGGAGGLGGAGGTGGGGTGGGAGCALPLTYYVDLDTDGWGTNVSVVACVQPAQTALQAGDCDDGRGFVHPGATDDVGDGIDADCDGSELCFADADGDGHVPTGGGVVASANLACGDAGEAPPGAPQDDCDDGRFYVNPGWPELCDGVDNDCDGSGDGGACMTGCAPSGTLHDAVARKSYQACDADELYADAETNCASIGSHLVRVDSAAENLKVQNLCNVLGTDCWLGATDRAVEGTWTWPDGQIVHPSQPGIYTAFGSGQPSSGGLLDCLAINAFNGTWRAWDCATPMEYVCEFP